MRILLRIFALVALRECTTISAFLAQPQRAFVQKTAKEWAGVTALATLLAANPLVVPQTARAVEAPVTALVINVDVSDPKAIAKSAFGHRSELATAAKDFLQAAKTLGTDLEGIVPPNSASASIRLPTDLKASARDAASGRARVMVNGSPMYVEIGSEQGLLSMRILVSSPFLPKIPFMAATEEALKIPVTFRMGKSEAVSAAPPAKSDGLLGSNIHRSWHGIQILGLASCRRSVACHPYYICAFVCLLCLGERGSRQTGRCQENEVGDLSQFLHS
jgi:hypothetical protein